MRVNWGVLWKEINPKSQWLTSEVYCLFMQRLQRVEWHFSMSSIKNLDYFHQDITSCHHVTCIVFSNCIFNVLRAGEERIWRTSRCSMLPAGVFAPSPKTSRSELVTLYQTNCKVSCDVQRNTWTFGEYEMFPLLSVCNLIRFWETNRGENISYAYENMTTLEHLSRV